MEKVEIRKTKFYIPYLRVGYNNSKNLYASNLIAELHEDKIVFVVDISYSLNVKKQLGTYDDAVYLKDNCSRFEQIDFDKNDFAKFVSVNAAKMKGKKIFMRFEFGKNEQSEDILVEPSLSFGDLVFKRKET